MCAFGWSMEQILTPEQHAQLEISSFPFKVDLHSICEILAAQPAAPQAQVSFKM